MKALEQFFVSKKETKQFTQVFTNWLKKQIAKRRPLIILLEGQLGAGKTQIIKWIAKELGVKGKVTSPTFVLWQIYPFKLNPKSDPFDQLRVVPSRSRDEIRNPKNEFHLNHIDLYRLENPKDIFKLSLRQKFRELNNLFLIEWGERIEKYIQEPFVKIKMEIAGKNKRKITITK